MTFPRFVSLVAVLAASFASGCCHDHYCCHRPIFPRLHRDYWERPCGGCGACAECTACSSCNSCGFGPTVVEGHAPPLMVSPVPVGPIAPQMPTAGNHGL
jgi:hypothetical protein